MFYAEPFQTDIAPDRRTAPFDASTACKPAGVVREASIENAGSDLEVVRGRFISKLLEPEVDAGEIEELLDTVDDQGTWPNIDYDDTSRTAFEHSRHLGHMVELARAYKKEESPFYRASEVKETIEATFNYWLRHDLISENWWHNQVRTPRQMGNLLLLMDEDLTRSSRPGRTQLSPGPSGGLRGASRRRPHQDRRHHGEACLVQTRRRAV